MKKRFLFVIAVASFVSCDSKPETQPQPPKEIALVEPIPPGDTESARSVMKLQAEIDFAKKSYKSKPTWLIGNRLVGAYMSRYRLSGDLNDLVDAKNASERVSRDLDDPPTIQISRAFLFNAIHEVEKSRSAAARALKISRTGEEKAAATGLLADADFLSGKLDEAREGYQRAQDLRPSSGALIRLSSFFQKTGQWPLAVELADAAIKQARLEGDWNRAFALLLRGTIDLERGKLDSALQFYSQADEKFEGWFLVEEHIAEIFAAQGKNEEAKKRYENILGRVQSGQFFYALSQVEAELGNKERSDKLRTRALKKLEDDVSTLPSAMGGHAIDLILEIGDPKRALELATANHELRPDFEGRVKLAQALMKNGQHDTALKTLEPVLVSRWNTVAYNVTAAKLYDRAGDDDKAKRHKEAAETIREGAFAEYAWLK